jgi:hypothetical protein
MAGVDGTRGSSQLPLRCRCGHVRGVASGVTPSAGLRFICYCGDCQAFSRFLRRPDVLDAAGGTDIFQMPIGRVKFMAGTDALRCLHFSEKVFRWYTDCCKTPIGNTAGPRFPVVGLIHSFMSHGTDGRSRDEALGPPLSLRLIPLRALMLLGWWMRGLGRPNPFFDEQTHAPLSAPRVFTPAERAALLS